MGGGLFALRVLGGLFLGRLLGGLGRGLLLGFVALLLGELLGLGRLFLLLGLFLRRFLALLLQLGQALFLGGLALLLGPRLRAPRFFVFLLLLQRDLGVARGLVDDRRRGRLGRGHGLGRRGRRWRRHRGGHRLGPGRRRDGRARRGRGLLHGGGPQLGVDRLVVGGLPAQAPGQRQDQQYVRQDGQPQRAPQPARRRRVELGALGQGFGHFTDRPTRCTPASRSLRIMVTTCW
ncbi:hypothetical protein ACFSTJ_03570 [Ottowia pentelensis]|uniref:hypothetical protein n=1 Tax=Ottowia pentelensis TaxID=511108 RepID=UPI00363D1CD4